MHDVLILTSRIKFDHKNTFFPQLSEISGIEADDIEFAKGKGTFPFDMSVVDINSDLDWSIRSGPLDQRPLYILDDGAMVYYRYVIY